LKILRGQSIEIAVRHVLGGAGIVDQRVETAPRGGRRDDFLAILIARYVALNHVDLAARRAAEIGGLFGFLFAGGIVDDNARAALGQDGGRRRSEPGRRACYDRAQNIPRHPHFLIWFLADPMPAIYHIARGNGCKSAKLRCAELVVWRRRIPALQGAFPSALVMAAAFPHHALQQKPPIAWAEPPGNICVRNEKTGERCE
jgi:hypothetical protein